MEHWEEIGWRNIGIKLYLTLFFLMFSFDLPENRKPKVLGTLGRKGLN